VRRNSMGTTPRNYGRRRTPSPAWARDSHERWRERRDIGDNDDDDAESISGSSSSSSSSLDYLPQF
jgi:hypothetical protein